MINKWIIVIGVSLLNSLWAPAGNAQTTRETLLGDFNEGWEKDWVSRKLMGPETRYEVVTENDTNKVLQATSTQSGSALWHMLKVRPGRVGKISWRWKIENPLYDDTAERSKRGDDYAARIYVVFEPHMVNWNSRTLCYVWSAKAEIGDSYPSPYAKNAHIIVLQSGKDKRKQWITEERNFVADYNSAFGKAPELLTAVAVMVDTENSAQDARAWFDDIVIEYSDPDAEKTRKEVIRMGN